jgi:hypothetical protein
MRSQMLGKPIGIIEPQSLGSFGDNVDVLQDALLRFFSKAFQSGDFSIQANLLEGHQVHHAELLVEFHRFLGSKPRDTHHIPERCGNFCTQLF